MLASQQNLPQNENQRAESEQRKPYQKPEIIHELELEIQAGSPINNPNPLDLFSDN